MEDLTVITQKVYELAAAYLPKLALALVTLIVGFWIIGKVVSLVRNAMIKRGGDPTLQNFLGSLVSILLKVVLLISVAGMIGVQTTSFVAILGAAGLAVGLALQGSLANFAGGVLLLLFRPFKVGDFVEMQGHTGVVNSIQIFNTVLKSLDNKTIILANGPVAGGAIVNYSTEEKRRVDFTFGIGYSDDIDKAKAVLAKLIDNDKRIINEPAAPFVAVSELADSSVNFVVRVWCNAADYWGIYFDMQENVKKAFDAENISIPFPQTDVHLFKEN